jgi:hypothetical protein
MASGSLSHTGTIAKKENVSAIGLDTALRIPYPYLKHSNAHAADSLGCHQKLLRPGRADADRLQHVGKG